MSLRLQLALKWLLDRVLAAVGLVFLAPIFGAIWVWVRRDAGRPVFIAQLRAGKDGVPFRLLKVRTMVPNAVEVGQELGLTEDPFGVVPEDPRITNSGRVLRRTGLDELPQLVNILKGEMSVVGPRTDPV
jgi:lipopolysaccharide/colanic/teichoic acid biosynthesis glycosyltransferase